MNAPGKIETLPSTSQRQRRCLTYLDRIGGAVQINAMPAGVANDVRLRDLAARGYVRVNVEITDAGRKALKEGW